MCRVTGWKGDGRCESPVFLFREYYALPGVVRWLEHAGEHAGVFRDMGRKGDGRCESPGFCFDNIIRISTDSKAESRFFDGR